ncbi:MAG: hypothetical protein CSA62_15435, partial [Planctomycetota bacterium]
LRSKLAVGGPLTKAQVQPRRSTRGWKRRSGSTVVSPSEGNEARRDGRVLRHTNWSTHATLVEAGTREARPHDLTKLSQEASASFTGSWWRRPLRLRG